MVFRARAPYYLIEFINCYASIYYSNFLFFYLKQNFGFSDAGNLFTAAFGGLVYVAAAWSGGRYAERRGCMNALNKGYFIMTAALVIGFFISVSWVQVVVYAIWTAGVCFVWPSLEALISEKADRRLADVVGMYNVTWAAGGAIAYFTTGWLLETLGMKSLFWLPAVLIVLQWAMLPFSERWCRPLNDEIDVRSRNDQLFKPIGVSTLFLRLAWFANPFSYIAINTVIPLIPFIADKLGMSTAAAGMICSFWMFARLFSFAALWRWTKWHYRFSWLAGSFLSMIASFFGFLTSPSIPLLILSEAAFGAAIGLIYYSSLYYSLNASDKRSTNAGIHEAVIGAGLFAGPAVGAAALYLAPAASAAGAWSVGGVLCAGFTALLLLKRKWMTS